MFAGMMGLIYFLQIDTAPATKSWVKRKFNLAGALLTTVL